MAAANKRRTLVNFRVSGEEYESLKAAAYTYGSPNLSEYVRKVVLTSARFGLHPDVTPELDGPALEENVLRLQATIQQLNAILEGIGGAFVREVRKQVVSTPAAGGNARRSRTEVSP
jgi:hypothetical protein